MPISEALCLRRHDTQHQDNQHNDIKHKDILHNIIKRVSPFKSCLILKIDLQNTQALQLNWNGNYLQVVKRPSEEDLGFE